MAVYPDDISKAEAVCIGLFNSVCPAFASLPHIAFVNDSRVVKHLADETSAALGIWPHTPRYSAAGELDPKLPDDTDVPWKEWRTSFNQDCLFELCGNRSGAFATMYGMIVAVDVGEETLLRLWPRDAEMRSVIWTRLPDIVKDCKWAIAPSDEGTFFLLASRPDSAYLVSSVCKYAESELIETGYLEPAGASVELHGLFEKHDLDAGWIASAADFIRSQRSS